MDTNEMPSELEDRLVALDEMFAVCSFDVSSDGAKAVIFGFGEDLDFPQLFVYVKGDNSLMEIETGSELIGVPIGRAFWGDKDKCILLSRWDNDTIYKVVISDQMTVQTIIDVEDVDEYILGKLDVVEDLLRPRAEVVFYENEHEKWADDFVNAMATYINFLKIGANGLNENERKQYLEKIVKPFKHVLWAMECANEKNELEVDIEKVKKAISV